ncbi:MAG: pentapeptide repeat-containing protein [Cyanobacteria bacterium J06627_8]
MNRSADFTHRDWRDRSFRFQDLKHANFEGADVRGCDFRQAQLEGASFTNARIGRTLRQTVLVLIVTLLLLVVAFPSLSQMVFASLGVATDDPAWTYVLILRTVLAIAGASTGLQQWRHAPPRARRIMHRIAVMAVCTITGFVYGVSLTDTSRYGAIAGVMVGGSVGYWLGGQREPRWWVGGFTLLGAIAAYGFCFTAGTTASTLIHAQVYGQGILWAVISFTYAKWTIDSLVLTSKRLTYAMGTCFKSLIEC